MSIIINEETTFLGSSFRKMPPNAWPTGMYKSSTAHGGKRDGARVRFELGALRLWNERTTARKSRVDPLSQISRNVPILLACKEKIIKLQYVSHADLIWLTSHKKWILPVWKPHKNVQVIHFRYGHKLDLWAARRWANVTYITIYMYVRELSCNEKALTQARHTANTHTHTSSSHSQFLVHLQRMLEYRELWDFPELAAKDGRRNVAYKQKSIQIR